MGKNRKKSEGWTNAATHSIYVMIGNNQDVLKFVDDQARSCISQRKSFKEVVDGVLKPKQAERYILADILKDYFEDFVDDLLHISMDEPKRTAVAVFASAGFGEVNWRQLADYIISDKKDRIKEEREA